MNYRKLDSVLNSPVRLAVVSILTQVKKADFNYLKEQTETTQGNLSHQIKKLKEAEYIEVIKSFQNNYPKTECKITKKGVQAFAEYVENIKTYLNLD